MKRLIGWSLAVVALLVVVKVVGPTVGEIGWKSGLHGQPDSHLSGKSFGKIGNGMNREEVTAILGLPSEDHMGSVAGSGTLEDGSRFLIWSDGSTQVTVHFSPEGLVISKSKKRL